MKPANYSCFLGDESNCTNILLVKRILASLSIAGSFAMIFLIWLFKKYQFFAQADSVEPSPKCTFEAVMITISVWAILLWVILITFNLYWSAVAKKSTERFEIYYHLIGWGIPVVISVIPFSSNKYGPAGVWWIQNTVQPDNASFTLYLLQIVSSSLKGAGNAIVFSMDKETFKHLNLADLRLFDTSLIDRKKCALKFNRRGNSRCNDELFVSECLVTSLF
ncbi:uncharacterized protein TRIADDRAFT_59515 [Trichoplax adhaerens]|uniref:G-protein coupled receptors family 2 profile 2 domain-containing protein n=1 Tax=Trichoplax adhaerens TaxID=10228 RepID=B3S5M2_TRIAD|nr:hypothetical protein TRIADDRAFT_59515 [Trichoplax adhaerens]EDV21981.1 hypothetical protein TRIADDRAFT_59515 [Trichoplax adhaerens]|eukprot:XP_002115618.1 hypothetical protein TRIADDRAFT_59515 [Trichoplax adhaerens]